MEFKPISFTNVKFTDQFWSQWQKTLRTSTLPIQYQQLKSTGRIDSLRLDWTKGSPGETPHQFWDSDIAKWIEASSYALATEYDKELDTLLDEVIEMLKGTQQTDGYLNIHYTVVEPEKRWKDLAWGHELYCAGHLIEAAVAHYEATGKRSLLDILIRYVDYISSVFGREPGQIRGYCGHEEIELSLVKLYQATGEQRFLNLASYFIDERGQEPNYLIEEIKRNGGDPYNHFTDGCRYMQADKPVREQDKVTGHAVRAMYLYTAMADLAKINKDIDLKTACEFLWSHLCERNIYITGGIGPSHHNEGFTKDYDLPNDTTYAETCAAVGLVFWAYRMLQLDCDSKYADILERSLYNGSISGISLDGKRFFYVNPMKSNGAHNRSEWFGCACCPPNIARLIASVGQYLYTTSDNSVAVHLFAQSSAKLQIGTRPVEITQETNYPWDGSVKLTIGQSDTFEYTILLRIPGWCNGAEISINGEKQTLNIIKGYAVLKKVWHNGDTVHADMPMHPVLNYANPLVDADLGRAALSRGPLVYCLEEADNGNDLSLLTIDNILTAAWDNDLLNGVFTITGTAKKLNKDNWGNSLYRNSPPETTDEMVTFTAVPYYSWNNRGKGEMQVWLRN